MTFGDPDPESFVNAPIVAALNGIVVRALIGFGAVATLTTVPLLVPLDPAIHELVHLALPIGWVAYAIATALLLAFRPIPADGDPWRRAVEVDPGLAGMARLTSTIMQVGWVACVAAVLVHHHLASPSAVLATFVVDIPLMLAVWILATFAWAQWCRRCLASAEREWTRRLRWYWARAAGR